jgi:hypothetical protein
LTDETDGDSPDDEVHLYHAVEEYEARPAFVGRLTLAHAEIDKIVAKYELAKTRDKWSICGLNSCTRPHRNGIVLRTHNGLETNCGNGCGLREFGIPFKDIEARYKKAQDAKARRIAVANLLDARSALLAEVESLLPQAKAVTSRVVKFNATLGSQSGLWRQIGVCARQGGSIRVGVSHNSDWAAEGGRSQQLQTVGRIAGYQAFSTDGTSLPHLIANRVLPWLNETLVEKHLAKLKSEELQTVLKESDGMREILRRTKDFILYGAQLTAPENVKQIETVIDNLVSKSSRSDAREALRKWERFL